MDMHPFASHEVARLRTEERLSQGLAAYRALRLREEQAAAARAAKTSPGTGRILDRLIGRKRAAERAARPAI
jgi:hypothetical protein